MDARVRAAFRGGPILLDEGDGEDLAHALVRCYIDSPLPRRFMDGVLLFVAQVTRRRYPLFLHGAQLLADGATDDDVAAWLELDRWEDPGVLITEWERRSGMSLRDASDGFSIRSLSGDPLDPETRLTARTLALLALAPSLGGDLFGVMKRHVLPSITTALLRLLELWTSLHFRYRALPRFDVATEPAVTPVFTRLEGLLRPRARILRPSAGRAPSPLGEGEHTDEPEQVALTMIEHFPVGVIQLDREGRIRHENSALRELLGVPPNRPSLAIGMRILDLPNVRQAFGALDALIRDGTPFELRRVEFVSIFGRQTVVNVVARPIRSPGGEQTGSVIMVVDATREVALEQQVVDMGRADLFASLVGRIAHDLNNALVGVKGHASILALRGSDESETDSAYRHTARQLTHATDRLAVVIDGLLALANRGNPAEQAPIDASALVSGCEDLLRSVLPPQVTLHLHAPTGGTATGVLPCRIGEAQLRQVLLNLCAHARDNISNWLDGRPGRIEVRLERRAEPIACVAIVVRDDGRPASPEALERLFDPIAHSDSESAGAGLMMPLSRALVASYGGTLTANVDADEFNRVTLILPELVGLSMTAPGLSEEPTPLPPLHILVVEDNDVVRNLCVDVLSSRGFRVTWAECGAAGLRHLRQSQPDLAIIDVGLPDMSGLDLARGLVGHEQALPLVVMSGDPREVTFQDEFEGRPMRFLKKPFRVPDLLRVIEELVRPAQ